MLWVQTESYVGQDRRRATGRRLLDRRRLNTSFETPSVAVLLRQLNMRRLDLELGGPDVLQEYSERLAGVICVAEQRGEAAVATTLRNLEKRLSGIRGGRPPRGDLSEVVKRHLDSAVAVLVH